MSILYNLYSVANRSILKLYNPNVTVILKQTGDQYKKGKWQVSLIHEYRWKISQQSVAKPSSQYSDVYQGLGSVYVINAILGYCWMPQEGYRRHEQHYQLTWPSWHFPLPGNSRICVLFNYTWNIHQDRMHKMIFS